MHSTEFSGSGGLIFFAHIKWFLRHIKFTTLPRTFPTRYSQILFSFSLCNTYPHTHTHTRGSWVYFSLKRIKILNSKARPLIPTLVHTYTHTHTYARSLAHAFSFHPITIRRHANCFRRHLHFVASQAPHNALLPRLQPALLSWPSCGPCSLNWNLMPQHNPWDRAVHMFNTFLPQLAGLLCILNSSRAFSSKSLCHIAEQAEDGGTQEGER